MVQEAQNPASENQDTKPPLRSFESGPDAYSEEKIDRTMRDVEMLLETIRNYRTAVAYCKEQGIPLPITPSEIDTLRGPNGPAGPGSDLTAIRNIFYRAQEKIAQKVNFRTPELQTRFTRNKIQAVTDNPQQ